MRNQFLVGSGVSLVAVAVATLFWPLAAWALVVIVPVVVLGVIDLIQPRQAVRRNFPVIGHFRYLLELIRPEINQYFVESNSDGRPFSRNDRSVVYQRAKGELDTLPFGTQRDVYASGYEWINHSLAPVEPRRKHARIMVGNAACRQPYSASILNVSAMSYGSLSRNAILALNGGAKLGGFAHNTGEGGISPYHLEPGGDLIWQIGTGYFGCRTADGRFNPDEFAKRAVLPAVKMIEIKLSQGAKPGHGGILPAAKLTPEIAAIRGVPLGHDVLSPPAHSAFATPLGLLRFVEQLRDGSGGKPVGFKLCVGKRHEFLGIVKAMLESGIVPDFITVDGAEGGTGAAPLEFSDSIGTPLSEGLSFVHQALIGAGLRELGDYGQGRGVEIWMEVHGRDTAAPPVSHAIMQAARHSNVGVCWNSNPADIVNGSVKPSFDLLKPYIKNVHINELANDYPWRELFSLLRKSGYERYTLAEVQESKEPERFMRWYRALWRELNRA